MQRGMGPGSETPWTDTIAYHEEKPLPEPTGQPSPFDPGVPQHSPPPWERQ